MNIAYKLKNTSHPTVTDQTKLARLCALTTTRLVVTPVNDDIFSASVYATETNFVIGTISFNDIGHSIYVHFSSAEAFSAPFYTAVPTGKDILNAMRAESLRQSETLL